MADKTWVSTGSADLNVGANWSGGTVPVGGDAVYFRAEASTVSPNLNMGAFDAVNFIRVHVQRGWPGNIGTTSAHLQCHTDLLIHEGRGTVYYSDGTAAGSTDEVHMDSDEPNFNSLVLDGGTFDKVFCYRGGLTIKSAFSWLTTLPDNGQLNICYRTNPASDARVTILPGAATIPNLLVAGGVHTINCGVTRGEVSSGTLRIDSGAIAFLQQLGGEIDWRTTGTGGEIQQYGGVFTTLNSNQPKAITTYFYINGELKYDSNIDAITPRLYGGKKK